MLEKYQLIINGTQIKLTYPDFFHPDFFHPDFFHPDFFRPEFIHPDFFRSLKTQTNMIEVGNKLDKPDRSPKK
ncbi:hypothetical protein [Methanosarcina barkeri]|uniref:hypothetical protein n=1 Tax=Methanosarcina barkeri TaxID=2208 RepID=UPI000A466200|nr:hypothetical protein [Methanosarcina barkeri]